MLATRNDADQVTLLDFEAAIERIVAGLEKRNRLMSLPRTGDRGAFHEMGHAIAAMALPDTDPRAQDLHHSARGLAALGYTMQRPLEDHYLMSHDELVHRMVVLLSGRAAEELIFQQVSTGASDDLVKTTEIARSMVVRFGMDPRLGQVAYEVERSRMMPGRDIQPRMYSEDTAASIDNAVRGLVDDAYRLSQRILAMNEGVLRQSGRRPPGTRDTRRRAAGRDQRRGQSRRSSAGLAPRPESGRVRRPSPSPSPRGRGLSASGTGCRHGARTLVQRQHRKTREPVLPHVVARDMR